MQVENRTLLLAPRRLGGTDSSALVAKYFPGLDLDLSSTRAEDLFAVLEGTDFEGLPEATYTTVIIVEALEHSPVPARVIEAAARSLLEEGTLLVSVPFALPLHESGTDYWRIAPDGLRALLASAGFTDIEVIDTGEEVAWDVVPESPGLISAWMPYPRTCFARARKGKADESNRSEEKEAEALRELLASDLEAMRGRADELTTALESSVLQAKKYQERIRHLEEDSKAKDIEMDKVAQWARGMESELLALKTAAEGPSQAEQEEQATPPHAQPEPSGGSGEEDKQRKKRGFRK